MVFASSIFLYYFLPIFLALYYLSPKGVKSYTLAFASYLFYGWWRPDFVILMLVSTLVDYTAGRRITAARAKGEKGKAWLLLSVFVNLGLLAYFKYANFGIDTLNTVFQSFGADPMEWPKVVLPVGISFYTFQTLSYTIDVYRGNAAPVRHFRDFMCYVAMFPQLVAGPIVRYNTIAEQLHDRTHTFAKFFQGVLAFQLGLAKKVLIADQLGPLADYAFGAESLSIADAWLGVLAYTFQIYFDFSGYSDMAIGLGLMMGFRFPINFNSPYRSISITDFWRRWHISLSSFLRDYLYIALGGNRGSKQRTYVNLSLTMLLGGLWHGAAWTFIVWGAYQGLWLVFERLIGKRSFYSATPVPVQIALTFLLAMIGWVFFRATDMEAAGSMFRSMAALGEPATFSLLIRPIHWIVFSVAVGVIWFAPTTQCIVPKPSIGMTLAIQVFFILCLLQLHLADNVPFLYFQF
ncbi:MAG: alginate O-acetyltransferase complex protein AlgI [Planctomycetota bacterium]